MSLRPFKFLVQAVVTEHQNGDAAITGERILPDDGKQPFVLYGLPALRAFADDFERQLHEAEQK